MYKLQFKNIYLQFYYVSVAFAPGQPFTTGSTAFTYHRTALDFIVLIGLFLVRFSFNFSVRFHVVDSFGNSSVFTACTLNTQYRIASLHHHQHNGSKILGLLLRTPPICVYLVVLTTFSPNLSCVQV